MRPDATSPLDLGECLGAGGEARVFALKSDPALVAKMYHQPTPAHAEKLAIMIRASAGAGHRQRPDGDRVADQAHL